VLLLLRLVVVVVVLLLLLLLLLLVVLLLQPLILPNQLSLCHKLMSGSDPQLHPQLHTLLESETHWQMQLQQCGPSNLWLLLLLLLLLRRRLLLVVMVQLDHQWRCFAAPPPKASG
jgi:hypothetical protein